jgi:hypothetical protein
VALRDLPSVVVAGDVAPLVRHGRVLPLDVIAPAGGPAPAWAVLDEGGDLLAVYEPRGADAGKPSVVVAAPA